MTDIQGFDELDIRRPSPVIAQPFPDDVAAINAKKLRAIVQLKRAAGRGVDLAEVAALRAYRAWTSDDGTPVEDEA